MTLPPLFVSSDGTSIFTAAGWSLRREQLMSSLLEIEYGALPPPVTITSRQISSQTLHDSGNNLRQQIEITCQFQPPVRFTLVLLIPDDPGPCPVVLNGDACWGYLTPEVARLVLSRGYILATFDRTEIAPDAGVPARDVGLYAAFPDHDFGALSAWAWGYHRAVDCLNNLPQVDSSHIAITGHSRGGKAVLLAGATDERIALTNPNNSGCGGAGCFRIQGEGCETLADIVDRFPFWFCSRFPDYIGRENLLPFDQHSLKACVAPRALLSTEALGDLWANPLGSWYTHAAAGEVYRLLDAPQRIAIWYRQGGHNHGLVDFEALLDFCDWQFKGIEPTTRFNTNPFAE